MVTVYNFKFDFEGTILYSDAPFYNTDQMKIGEYFPFFEDLNSIAHLSETPIPAYEFEVDNQRKFVDLEFIISDENSARIFELKVIDRSTFYQEFQNERSVKNQARILNDLLANKCSRLESKINSLDKSIMNLIQEIGSPSGNIKSIMNLMLENFESNIRNTDKLKSLINDSAAEAEKVSTFINKLKEISKITNGSVYQRLEYISVKNIFEEAKLKVTDSDTFSSELIVDAGFEIYVNRYHFIDIFKQIMLQSKSRASERKVKLKVTTKLDLEKKYVEIVFHDDGRYLNELQQTKIFDLFYNQHPDEEKMVSLSMVKHTVNMYNGELTLQSAKRVGVKISLLFKDILPRRTFLET